MSTFRYQPNDLPRLTHVGPETVRDWRRRGFIPGCGAARLSSGEWVEDESDPRLTGQEKWRYSVGDVLRIALAPMVAKLGPSLAVAFDISESIGPFVLNHVNPARYGAPAADERFVVGWPLEYGEEVSGKPAGMFQLVRLTDLNYMTNYVRVGGIILDLAGMVDALPAALTAELRE